MRRLSVVLLVGTMAAASAFGSGVARAYPVAPTLTLDLHTVVGGASIVLDVDGFCSPTVHVDITGPSLLPIGDIATGVPYTFTAPSALGVYTVTATGGVTCSTASIGTIPKEVEATSARASASATFTVVPSVRTETTLASGAAGAGAPAPSTTSKSAAATAPDTTPNTGTNSLPIVRLAVAILLGGGALVMVARMRRRRPAPA